MDGDELKLSERYLKVSPWPIFVALGLVLSEAGILFNLLPVAVGGLLLLGGSVSGIVAEVGYTSMWKALLVCGAVLVVVGGAMFYVGTLPAATGTQVDERGLAILIAAGSLLMGAIGVRYLDREQSRVAD